MHAPKLNKGCTTLALVHNTQLSLDGHRGAPSFRLFARSLVCPRFPAKLFGALGKHSCASVSGRARKQSAVWESAHVFALGQWESCTEQG